MDGTGIDWFQVKASGHEFAMVKATESLNYVNPYFIQDCLVMRAAGVSRGGAYHYADVRQSPRSPGRLLFGDRPGYQRTW